MKTPNAQITRHEFLRRTAAFAGLGALAPRILRADEAAAPRRSRISYYCNGEIHVGEPGQPEGTPLTSGHWDFKPSWSKTGDMLVCFRRLKDDPVTINWLSAIFIINEDGTGFHQLSDGTFTDFNPTWTRDGKNTPVWNRKTSPTGGFQIMAGKAGGKPGEEVALTDKRYTSWVHSALNDGRLFVSSNPPQLGAGYYLMTPNPGGEPKFERVECELAKKGILDRVSISPSEKKVCFEFQPGFQRKGLSGRMLGIADFDAQNRVITNPKPFANEEGKPIWFAYPRWINGESAVVYHSTETGKGQLYVFQRDDGSIKRVSTQAGADYRYPHGEAAPC